MGRLFRKSENPSAAKTAFAPARRRLPGPREKGSFLTERTLWKTKQAKAPTFDRVFIPVAPTL
jgi:hypothetical protein